MFARIQKGQWLRVRGSVQEDNYSRELTINAQDIQTVSHPDPTDDAEGEKRVELHLHTNMSQMDAMNPISDYVKRAKEWGIRRLLSLTMQVCRLIQRRIQPLSKPV